MIYSGEIIRGFGLRLLVVDDNEEITEAITVYCGAEQTIDCEVINDGPQGLERIRNDKFDLILLDIAMPVFSGWDILQSLKKDRLVESKNIVIFTASSDQKLFNEMKNAGVKEIFKKPCSLDDLTTLMEKYRPRA
jgi:CheY-like chemotaxis protein